VGRDGEGCLENSCGAGHRGFKSLSLSQRAPRAGSASPCASAQGLSFKRRGSRPGVFPVTPGGDSEQGFQAESQLHALRRRQRALDAEHSVGVIEEPQSPLLVLAIRQARQPLGIVAMPDLLTQLAQLPGIALRGRLQQLCLSGDAGRLGQVLQLAGNAQRVLERDFALLDRLHGGLQCFELTSQRDLAVSAGGGDVGVRPNPVDGGVLTELVERLAAIALDYPGGRDIDGRFVRLGAPGNAPQPTWLAFAVSEWLGSSDASSHTSVGHLETAREQAQSELVALRARFVSGLPPGPVLFVKAPFRIDDDHNEYMWIVVTRWDSGGLHGLLANDPSYVKGLKDGDDVSVPDAEVWDWELQGPGVRREGNFGSRSAG
jgi:uncharacterized protein YegJ (DUF2314 family)